MKYPVYRSPVSEEQIKELLVLSKYKKFYIHDMKSGKLKHYDFKNKLPNQQIVDLSIGYGTIAKIGFATVTAWYVYKLITFKPFKNKKTPSFSYKDWLKDYNERMAKERVKQSPNSPENVSKSPNGWVIEDLQ